MENIRVKIVMLPTKEKSQILEDILDCPISLTFCNDPDSGFSNCRPVHLYFLSDEEVSKGDTILTNKNEILKAVGVEKIEVGYKIEVPFGYIGNNFCKKIISSTDPSLNLPRPSESFIQTYITEYNEGNVIKECLVEYEKVFINEFINNTVGTIRCSKEILKIDSNSEITIHQIKNSCTKEDVTELQITNLGHLDQRDSDSIPIETRESNLLNIYIHSR